MVNNRWERYKKIEIYCDRRNRANNYAIITYTIEKPGHSNMLYQKRIPESMITEALREFELQNGARLENFTTAAKKTVMTWEN